jgi:hypothetical protein
MKWISKYPPLYVRSEDEWFNEKNNVLYQCDVKERVWWQTGCESIPFPPKTKVFESK